MKIPKIKWIPFDIYEKLITVKKGGGNDGSVKTSGAMPKMPVQK